MLERNDAQHLRENSGRNVSSDFSVSRIAPLRLMSFLHCQIDLLRYLLSYNFILESLNHKSSSFRNSDRNVKSSQQEAKLH